MEFAEIPAAQLPGWIDRRLRANNLTGEAAVAERLSHFVEGNLLAAAQAIDLLALLYPAQAITARQVEDTIADHARFTVYIFGEACLTGETARVLRILQGLRRNKTEPILVLWALTREVRALCQVHAGLNMGEPSQALFKRCGIWGRRNSLVSTALRRLSQRRCEAILRQLARADLVLKGRATPLRKDIWQEIEHMALQMCGVYIC